MTETRANKTGSKKPAKKAAKKTAKKAAKKAAKKKTAKKAAAKKQSTAKKAAKKTSKKVARTAGTAKSAKTPAVVQSLGDPVVALPTPAAADAVAAAHDGAIDEITIDDSVIDVLGDIGSAESIEPEPEPASAVQVDEVQWSKIAVLEDQAPNEAAAESTAGESDVADLMQFAANTEVMAMQLAEDVAEAVAEVVEHKTAQLPTPTGEPTNQSNSTALQLAYPFLIGLGTGLLIALMF